MVMTINETFLFTTAVFFHSIFTFPKMILTIEPFNYPKADDKIFVCELSKNVQSKLYHVENSKIRGQTV